MGNQGIVICQGLGLRIKVAAPLRPLCKNAQGFRDLGTVPATKQVLKDKPWKERNKAKGKNVNPKGKAGK